MVKHLSGAKIEDMKLYVIPMQEKIIIHVSTNDLPVNKNTDEIANGIAKFANSIKTSENVIVSSIVSKKKKKKADLTARQKK